MPYIGNEVGNRFVASKAASVYSGNGSTTAFTLEHAVGSDEDILVSVDGVIQEPSVAYAVSSGTTLTFTAAPSSNSGNNIFVYYLFRTVATVDHPSTSALTATSGTFSTDLTVSGAFTSQGIDDNADATAITIDSSENVGIGDVSPDGSLHITRSGSSLQFVLERTTSNTGKFGIGINNGLVFNDLVTSTEYMKIDADGHVTMPKQSAFHAHKNSTDQNNFATGSNTIVWSAERFDQNSDFDLTENRFTAPVTGKYFLQINVRFEYLDTAATFYILNITTSNEGYNHIIDPDYFDSDAVYYTIGFSVLADMDANDTAMIYVNQNAGTAQTDIDGNPEYTWFSGHLVC